LKLAGIHTPDACGDERPHEEIPVCGSRGRPQGRAAEHGGTTPCPQRHRCHQHS